MREFLFVHTAMKHGANRSPNITGPINFALYFSATGAGILIFLAFAAITSTRTEHAFAPYVEILK
jgi:hypothetical protein